MKPFIITQYMPADIITKADTVLNATVGQRIFDNHYVCREINLSAPLTLTYIPKYVWDNDTCNFIMSLQAVALAVSHVNKPAISTTCGRLPLLISLFQSIY